MTTVLVALGVWIALSFLTVLWWPHFVGRTETEELADREDEERYWRSRQTSESGRQCLTGVPQHSPEC